MKFHRRLSLATLAFSLGAFAGRVAADEPKKPEAPEQAPAPAAKDTSARWSDIKNLSFDQRAQFATGLARLAAQLDEQIAELTARRAAMKSIANTKDWDFAMKGLTNSRSYLKGMGEEASKATPENWDQSKDRVGRAWVHSQEDYAKVKSSTTQ